MMMKIALIFILALIAYKCNSQDSDVVFDKMPYVEIENGILLTDSIVWGNFNHRFRIPIGFNFEFLGEPFDSVCIETSGRLVFDNEHHFFADAFSEISYQDVGYKDGRSHSPISYKHETVDSGRVLIIQFKNSGFAKDSLSFVNFQIRLYERNNEFELHMGSTNINDHTKSFLNGPYSGIYKIVGFKPIIFYYRLAVYGKPEDPVVVSDSGKGLDPFAYKLSSSPKEGTIYRFKTTLHGKK